MLNENESTWARVQALELRVQALELENGELQKELDARMDDAAVQRMVYENNELKTMTKLLDHLLTNQVCFEVLCDRCALPVPSSPS